MRRSVLIRLCCSLSLAASLLPASADLYPSAGQDGPAVLAERALLQWADGQEQLVIQTSFNSRSSNTLWVLSLPSNPTVRTASPGTLPTLQNLLQPPPRDAIRPWWKAVLLSIASSAAVFHLGRRLRNPAGLPAVTFTLSFILFSLFLNRTTDSGEVPPVLIASKQTSPFAESAQATIIAAESLDTANSAKLEEWLGSLAPSAGKETLDLIRQRLQNNGSILALNLEHPVGKVSSPALALSFPTPRPVYPASDRPPGGPPANLDLFVFGPGQATLEGLRIFRCSEPDYSNGTPQTRPRPRFQRKSMAIRHPSLIELTARAPVATWLRGPAPSPYEGASPMLRWYEFESRNELLYTRHAARIITANVASFALLGTLLILLSVKRSNPPAAMLHRVTKKLLAANLGMVLLTYWVIPKAPPRLYNQFPARPNLPGETAEKLLSAWKQNLPVNPIAAATKPPIPPLPSHPAWVPVMNLASLLPPKYQTNAITGKLLQNEDSPGNYGLWRSEESLTLLWYDADGAPHLQGRLGLNPQEPPE